MPERHLRARGLTLALIASATVLLAGPAPAQTYDPNYPVCLHVYTDRGDYYDCTYSTLPQCAASASGRAAQCVINPYFAPAYRDRRGRIYRSHGPMY